MIEHVCFLSSAWKLTGAAFPVQAAAADPSHLPAVPPAAVFAIGLAVIAWSVWHLRRRGARPAQPTRAPAENPGAREFQVVAQEAHQLLAEVQETARRVAAQVDNRAAKLNILLNNADDAICRMEALLAAGRAAPEAGPTASPAATQQRRVYALADAGIDARAIAQKCDMQPGEVALVLALRDPARGGPRVTPEDNL